jgi:DNA-binding protein HU-beta
MTKKELVEQIAQRSGIQKMAVEVAIDDAITIIANKLSEGESVYLRGLFTLGPVLRAAKPARVIGEKKEIIVPEHYAPYAKFSKSIRQAMSKLPVKK